jgi:hypothetical protein
MQIGTCVFHYGAHALPHTNRLQEKHAARLSLPHDLAHRPNIVRSYIRTQGFVLLAPLAESWKSFPRSQVLLP